MTIKLENLVNGAAALNELAQKDLSIAVSYRVAKLLKAAKAELDIYNEQRIKLLQDVGSTLSDDGSQYYVPEDKKAEFAEKYNQLSNIEVELPDRVDISGENITMSPDLLIALEPFIKIEM